jgi:RNA polymerase sigma factor (sigma-70 family)
MIRSDVTAQDTNVSDGALVIAVARRRHDALAEIYERHGAAVHEVAERICGVSSANELLHQVFLDLWHGPEDFSDSHGSLRAELLMRAHRMAVDDLRGNGAAEDGATASLTPPGRRLHGSERGEYAAISSDRAWPLLSQLPAAEHTAIWLTYFAGYTAAEVARLLDQSEVRIKQRLGSGLRGLRVLLVSERRQGASPHPPS